MSFLILCIVLVNESFGLLNNNNDTQKRLLWARRNPLSFFVRFRFNVDISRHADIHT